MEFEDLRGNSIRWKYVSGFPLDVHLTQADRWVGRLWKPTNNRPETKATLAGIEWRIDNGPSIKRIGFEGAEFWLGSVEMASFGLGEWQAPKRACFDGTRTYRFRFPDTHLTEATDARGDTVLAFRRAWSGGSLEGTIDVSRSCEPLDIPPLALFGVLTAVSGGLFKADPHPRYLD